MGKSKISAIERIRANINNEQRSAVVDEWSSLDDEFTVYWTPITLADKQKIQRHAQGDDQATTVHTLIIKAKDINGDPLFTLADKHDLMSQVGSKSLERIALKILGIEDEQITREK